MTEDPQKRFDVALASGAALASPAEPDPDAREVLDVDRLRGRPFFAAVEAHASAAARRRPSRWMTPHAEDTARTAQIDAVDAAARGLAREITHTIPGVRVAVLTGDEVLEAVMHNDRTRLGEHAGSQVSRTPEEAHAAGRQTHAWMYSLEDVNDAGVASAVTFPESERNPQWHLVFTARASEDPHAKREARLAGALEEAGEPLRAGFKQDAPTAALLRATNDHEIGHVLSHALGLRNPGAESAYASYLEENRADAFMVAMAVARDGRDETISQAYTELRDTYAVAALDWDHWTTPTIRAARDHARELHADGRLQFMSAPEVMRTFSGVAEAASLSEADYHGFRGALYTRTQDHDPPFRWAATEAGDAAAGQAMQGYLSARVRNATPGLCDARDAESWRDAMGLANPNRRRALELAGPQTRIDASARRARFLAYMTPGTPTERREFARELTTLFGAARELVGRDRQIADAEAGTPSRSHRRAEHVLARSERTAREIAGRRGTGSDDMSRLAQGLSISATALKAAGPWMAAAAFKLGRVETETRDAARTLRDAEPATRSRAPAPEASAG